MKARYPHHDHDGTTTNTSHIDIHIQTDIDIDKKRTAEAENAILVVQRVLGNVDEFIERTLHENDGIQAGSIFVQRMCRDVATVLHDIAVQLREDLEEGYFIGSMQQQVGYEDAKRLLLKVNGHNRDGHDDDDECLDRLSEVEVKYAMESVEALLLDVADALRSISVDEARDVAELSMSLAQTFVWLLRGAISMMSEHDDNLYAKIAGVHIEEQPSVIEIINEDDNGHSSVIDIDDCVLNNAKINETAENDNMRDVSRNVPRVQLYIPITPIITDAGKFAWETMELEKRPVLAVALAMVLWPTVFIAVPIVATDAILKCAYDASKDQPLIVNIEQGAAGALKIGRLYLSCGKIFAKQAIRVGHRQLKRRGVENVLQDAVHHTIYSIRHPIETTCRVVDGAKSAWNAVSEIVTGMQSIQEKMSSIHS